MDIKASQAKTHEQPFAGGMGFKVTLPTYTFACADVLSQLYPLFMGQHAGAASLFVLASDIRISAGVYARMNAAYIRIGLSACDMGSSYFLPRLVGTSVASELMLTGRFINAERALSTNLVSEVVADQDLEEAVRSYIDEMLATSPMGLRLTKEGLNMAIDAAGLEATMAIENRNQLMCSKTEDAKEGMKAFIEKRKPIYSDW